MRFCKWLVKQAVQDARRKKSPESPGFWVLCNEQNNPYPDLAEELLLALRVVIWVRIAAVWSGQLVEPKWPFSPMITHLAMPESMKRMPVSLSPVPVLEGEPPICCMLGSASSMQAGSAGVAAPPTRIESGAFSIRFPAYLNRSLKAWPHAPLRPLPSPRPDRSPAA